MCRELNRFLEMIVSLVPVIESARPGGTMGIQELCSLNNAIEKATLLLHYCGESSKLYMAITSEATILRCERIRNALHESLSQIQSMVPENLSAQIAEVLNGLRGAKFIIDSVEEKAGRTIMELLRQSSSTEDAEFEAVSIAASKLNITSPKALLIEKRSIKKLLDKFKGGDPKKEAVLKYLLFLLNKYGKRVRSETDEQKDYSDLLTENTNPSIIVAADGGSCENVYESPKSQAELTCIELQNEVTCIGCTNDSSESYIPPPEFRCPLSSELMYDPVVIASGQTYERTAIEKWFHEGNATCPKTQKILSNFAVVPNSCMKELISNWSKKHGITIPKSSSQAGSEQFCSWSSLNSSSISSLNNVSANLLNCRAADFTAQSDSCTSVLSADAYYSSEFSFNKNIESLKDRHPQISPRCNHKKCHSFSSCSNESYLEYFSYLSELAPRSQVEALDDFGAHLSCDRTYQSMLSNGFMDVLVQFLTEAYHISNVRAQRTGAQILLTFLNHNRLGIPCLSEDATYLLTSFIGSDITAEALMILQILCQSPNCRSSIATYGIPSVMKILDSGATEFLESVLGILCDLSSSTDAKFQILSAGIVAKLVPYLSDRKLARICIRLLSCLSDIDEAKIAISESNGCIASIAELLDFGSQEEQEHAVTILLALCSFRNDYCLSVMKEGIVPALVHISVNGNQRGKQFSMQLLYLLRDLREGNTADTSPCAETTPSVGISSCDSTLSYDQHSGEKHSTPKVSGFFGKMRFLKPRSLALF